MAKPNLRAVTDSDRLKEPANLREAVACSERELLVTMRMKLAAVLDAGVPPAYLAPISRQLREIDKEIRSLDLIAKQEGVEGDISSTPDEEFDASAF